MIQQHERDNRIRKRWARFLVSAALLTVVSINAETQAQMQCAGGAGRAGGPPAGGRAGGPGGGSMMGGGVNQMAQRMQMMQQAQQFQQMQQQAAMMQQAQFQRMQELARQRQTQSTELASTSLGILSSQPTARPTMSRRERLSLLIQQRREEQSQKRPSRRELVLQRTARNRQATQPTELAAVDSEVVSLTIDN
jgi:hypothetical protein